MNKFEEFIKKELKSDFIRIDIDDNNKDGHGHVLSVKIVMPCYCQAHCPFCFNKLTKETQVHDFLTFIEECEKSLDLIFSTVTDRKITLDITGNEPTFSIDQFAYFMGILTYYKRMFADRIDKIVLTSNSYHLKDVYDIIGKVVDILNISVHHPDYNVRVYEIFRTFKILDNDGLRDIIKKLNGYGVSVTAVAVIDKVHEDIEQFVYDFAKFADATGFKNARIRFDYTTSDDAIRNQFYAQFKDWCIHFDEQQGLATKHLLIDDYRVNLYLGVPDLVDHVVGVEAVIDDDGKLYLDYNKRYPLDKDLLEPMSKYIYAIQKN